MRLESISATLSYLGLGLFAYGLYNWPVECLFVISYGYLAYSLIRNEDEEV